MSVAVAVFAVLAALALVPIAAAVARTIAGPRRRRLLVPGAILVASTALLVVGARAFENGWPGTGGHHWAHQGMVPGGARGLRVVRDARRHLLLGAPRSAAGVP